MLTFFLCLGFLVFGLLVGYSYGRDDGKDDSQDSYREEDNDGDYYNRIF